MHMLIDSLFQKERNRKDEDIVSNIMNTTKCHKKNERFTKKVYSSVLRVCI